MVKMQIIPTVNSWRSVSLPPLECCHPSSVNPSIPQDVPLHAIRPKPCRCTGVIYVVNHIQIATEQCAERESDFLWHHWSIHPGEVGSRSSQRPHYGRPWRNRGGGSSQLVGRPSRWWLANSAICIRAMWQDVCDTDPSGRDGRHKRRAVLRLTRLQLATRVLTIQRLVPGSLHVGCPTKDGMDPQEEGLCKYHFTGKVFARFFIH